MANLILIRAAQTDWLAQGRLAGDTDLQLNELGHRQAAADAREVEGFGAKAVYCGADQPTRQTASIVADELHLKAKAMDEFREIDLGHWEGLTVEDFKDRFSKVYRQWRSDALSVEPPEGEALADLVKRLTKGTDKILKKADGCVILVLGHFAYASVRCRFSGGDYSRFWDYYDDNAQWHSLDLDEMEPEKCSK